MTRPSDTRTTPTALRVVGVGKRFGAIAALQDVSLDLVAGRVTAVLGENGAGKSTLIRIASGEMVPDSGELLIGGHPVRLKSPLDGMRQGIFVVHQEPQLINELSIAENIFIHELGERRMAGRYRRADIVRRGKGMLTELGMAEALPNPQRQCRDISAAERQMVDIARALSRRPAVLFLDEPNSSLTRRETDQLFAVVRRLRADGVAVALVSHRLSEVYEIADHVVVLRDGRKVADDSPSALPAAKAVAAMAGARLSAHRSPSSGGSSGVATSRNEPVLRLTELTGGRFSDVSFDLAPGEIVGMAGLVGSGRTEIARAVVGADPFRSGRLELRGKAVRFASPRQALRAGVAFIAEERRTEVFYGQDVRFNMTASTLERFSRFGFVNRRAQTAFSRELAERFAVKAASLDAPVTSLSGGNQQKLLLARALAADPSVLILDEPTRGVDVATKAEIYRTLRELAHQRGLAVWFISSELDEVLELADRVLVVRHGQLAQTLPGGPQAAAVVASALGERFDSATTAATESAISMSNLDSPNGDR